MKRIKENVKERLSENGIGILNSPIHDKNNNTNNISQSEQDTSKEKDSKKNIN